MSDTLKTYMTHDELLHTPFSGELIVSPAEEQTGQFPKLFGLNISQILMVGAGLLILYYLLKK